VILEGIINNFVQEEELEESLLGFEVFPVMQDYMTRDRYATLKTEKKR